MKTMGGCYGNAVWGDNVLRLREWIFLGNFSAKNTLEKLKRNKPTRKFFEIFLKIK